MHIMHIVSNVVFILGLLCWWVFVVISEKYTIMYLAMGACLHLVAMSMAWECRREQLAQWTIRIGCLSIAFMLCLVVVWNIYAQRQFESAHSVVPISSQEENSEVPLHK